MVMLYDKAKHIEFTQIDGFETCASSHQQISFPHFQNVMRVIVSVVYTFNQLNLFFFSSICGKQMVVLELASSSVSLCLCCLLITMSLHVITMSLPKLVDEREETERVKKN